MATYAPIPLAGSLPGDHRHVCAFDCPVDEYHVIFPFFRVPPAELLELLRRCARSRERRDAIQA